MNIYTMLLFFSFLISLFMASFVYYLNKKSPLNRQFAIFALIVAYCSFVMFQANHSGDISAAYFWHKKNLLFAMATAALLHFILIFTEKTRLLKHTGIIILIYATGGVISLMRYYINDMITLEKMEWGFALVYPDQLSALFKNIIDGYNSIVGILITVFSCAYYITATDTRKKLQAQYITIGLSIIVFSGILFSVMLPKFFSIDLPPSAAPAFTVAAIFISYSIWKYKLFTLDLELVAENIIAMMPDALLLADSSGTIIRANFAALDLFGCRSTDLLGKSYSGIFSDPSDVNDTRLWETQLFKNRTLHDMETVITTNSGDRIPVALSASLISAGEENFSGVVFIMRDLREQKEGESAMNTTMVLLEEKRRRLTKANRELVETTDQLIQIEKLTMLGELTASIMHELNQPLNVMKVVCQSIIRDIRNNRYDPKNAEEELPEIVRQIDKMTDIIEHMRTFSRSGSGDFVQMVNVNTIIEDTMKFITQQLKIHEVDLVTELSPDLKEIQGDPVRLEQMFLNLISNARHALESSAKDKKIIIVRTSDSADQYVSIEISDNGSGIPEDIRDKIFTPFFTTKDSAKGTGLGLSVVKRIVEEHNGKIEVESVAGEHTTFRILIPVNAG